VAACGPDVGHDATAEALAWAWQHWDRMASLRDPAAYLYRVGRTRGVPRRRRRALVLSEAVYESREPRDPRLAAALASLTERQRVAVYLVHGLGWTLADAAAQLGIGVSSLRNHLRRGSARLRDLLEEDSPR
jgi:DNA-directed RNA polymerase specialized sigma24 family protein